MSQTLAQILSKLERDSFSGEVDITSAQGHATLVIYEGQLLMAHRPIDRAMERLERMEWIRVPPREQWASIRSWETLLQQVLAANPTGYTRLVRFFKMDRLELFYRIFFWTNVEAHPRAFAVPLPDAVALGFLSLKKISPLLREAEKRLEEWPKIQAKIGSSKRVFVCQVEVPSLDPNQMDAIDRSFRELGKKTSAGVSMDASPYSVEELEILKSCDGRNSVQDLIRLLPDGEFLVLRRLVDLWRKGALRPKDDDPNEISFRVKVPVLQFRDLFASVLAVSLLCILGMLFESRLRSPYPASHLETVQVLQSLDLYRRMEGRYPLSLQELEKLPLMRHSSARFSAFSYTLEQPEIFSLTPKD